MPRPGTEAGNPVSTTRADWNDPGTDPGNENTGSIGASGCSTGSTDALGNDDPFIDAGSTGSIYVGSTYYAGDLFAAVDAGNEAGSAVGTSPGTDARNYANSACSNEAGDDPG